MSDAGLFKEKDEQLKSFEFTANADLQQNQTELAYRDLNSSLKRRGIRIKSSLTGKESIKRKRHQ